MEPLYFCPRWGSESVEWGQFFTLVKQAGYDGVEYAIPAGISEKELDGIWNKAEIANVLLIAQHYDTVTADYGAHYDQYSRWLERIRRYPVVKVNSQTGRDIFNFKQNYQLIRAARAIGLPVAHETHRNKFSFAAHVTRDYLEQIDDLQITLDLSHWVCTAESWLDDQPEAVCIALEQTTHIHARVGHPEGPQVPDPRDPFWKVALEKHLSWWDDVVARTRALGGNLTITPEFGPAPYMMQLPWTSIPVANQWDINLYMLNLLRERYRSANS